jgi:hypothetical protein
VEKDILPTAAKVSMGVIANAVHSLNKRSMGILSEELTHIHIGKNTYRTGAFLSTLS